MSFSFDKFSSQIVNGKVDKKLIIFLYICSCVDCVGQGGVVLEENVTWYPPHQGGGEWKLEK